MFYLAADKCQQKQTTSIVNGTHAVSPLALISFFSCQWFLHDPIKVCLSWFSEEDRSPSPYIDNWEIKLHFVWYWFPAPPPQHQCHVYVLFILAMASWFRVWDFLLFFGLYSVICSFIDCYKTIEYNIHIITTHIHYIIMYIIVYYPYYPRYTSSH